MAEVDNWRNRSCEFVKQCMWLCCDELMSSLIPSWVEPGDEATNVCVRLWGLGCSVAQVISPLSFPQLIRHDYPSLLDTQRCVEVCVALSTRAETTEETSDSSDLELSGKPPPPTVVPISDITHSMNSASARPINCAAPASHLESGRQPGTGTQPGSGSQTVSREACSETESVPKNDSNQSWEVLSKNSSTSTLLTMRQDESVPGDQLIPLWECLQVSFPSPSQSVSMVTYNIPSLLLLGRRHSRLQW